MCVNVDVKEIYNSVVHLVIAGLSESDLTEKWNTRLKEIV